MNLEKLKEDWLIKNYQDGESIEIDDNYCDCGLWYFGEGRCSCGNRRISYWVEGERENQSDFYLMVDVY